MNRIVKIAAGAATVLTLAACGINNSGTAQSDGSTTSGQSGQTAPPTVAPSSSPSVPAVPAGATSFQVGHTSVSGWCTNSSFVDQFGDMQYRIDVHLINTGTQYAAAVSSINVTLYNAKGAVIGTDDNLSPYIQDSIPGYDTIAAGQGAEYGGQDGTANTFEAFKTCKVTDVEAP